MKKLLKLPVPAYLFCLLILFSCKKEHSDEGHTNGNKPPVANAGPDQTLALPANMVNLDGSGSTDPDNNIAYYSWTKISGPSVYNILNANAVQTHLINLDQGITK
jgi:hypothetical protein